MDKLYKYKDVVQMLVDVIEQAKQNNDIVIVDRPMGWESIRDYAEEVVSDIPSAEPKEWFDSGFRLGKQVTEYNNRPKQGEWIPCTKSGLPLTEMMRREGQKWYGYRCSNCNHIHKGNALIECNFCPNCGARMVK